MGIPNALIGSKEGDKFRKFAQGLTLDNLVWLANEQLSRLHGRYLLQRKASDALELEVVDTGQADAVRDTRTLSGGEASSSALRWRWRFRIWSAIKPASTHCSLMKVLAPWTAKRWIPRSMRWIRSTPAVKSSA